MPNCFLVLDRRIIATFCVYFLGLLYGSARVIFNYKPRAAVHRSFRISAGYRIVNIYDGMWKETYCKLLIAESAEWEYISRVFLGETMLLLL